MNKINEIIDNKEKSLLNCIKVSDLYMLKNGFELGFYNQTLLLKIIHENIPYIYLHEEIADFLLDACVPDTIFINFLLSKSYDNNWSEKITQKIFAYDADLCTVIKNNSVIMFKIPDNLFLVNVDLFRDLVAEIPIWKIPNTKIANDRAKMLYADITSADDTIFLNILAAYESKNYDLVDYFIQPVGSNHIFVFMLAVNIASDRLCTLAKIFDYLDVLEPEKCLVLSLLLNTCDSDHYLIQKQYGFDFEKWKINRQKNVSSSIDYEYINILNEVDDMEIYWNKDCINHIYKLIEMSKCMLN